jgi:NAD(P)-dependent dehydrogenase (short-subunit alcohol dehydrogenase family)
MEFHMPAPTSESKAYVVTGPTSGIGRETALQLARSGTLILVGRDKAKLAGVEKAVAQRGGRAVSVVCDLSDVDSARCAAGEIVSLGLPIVGLLNNAGMREFPPTKTARGWDTTFATNHLGPFALTEALAPHLPDGAQIVFVASAVEDPERKPAKAVGFKGGRYISAEASARGEWAPEGATVPGGDAYATSKQCTLATALEFAREMPRLRVNAFEPGFTPNTGLGRDAPLFLKLIMHGVLPLMAPFMQYWSTPQQAGRVAARILTAASPPTGVYFNEKGQPMRGSPLAHDPVFTARVVAETRSLLAAAEA